jgi:hypothetical protein
VIEKNALYLAVYDELFINGETNIGGGRKVDYFDRNCAYAGLAYVFMNKLRFQLGFMLQLSTIRKYQLQFSFHHNF